MTPCFILSCRLPAARQVCLRGVFDPLPACQPHYDAIMLVLGEQAGRELVGKEGP